MRIGVHFVVAAMVSLAMVATMVTAGVASSARWQREGWKTDFSKHDVPFSEIRSGGPPKDGIPSIDDPKFIAAKDNDTLGDQEPVIRVEINGDARAYPLRILIWHEIVNDTVGGIPVAVTYCPLCNSAVLFDRRVGKDVLEFGTTGKLRYSDLIMYDRTTETWWQQFTGEAIIGSYTGTELKMLPVRVEGFSRFSMDHPDGKLLVPNDLGFRAYGENPYAGYDSRSAPYPLYTGDLPDDINPMARVVVVKDGDRPIAVSLAHIREKRSVEVGDIRLSWNEGQNSALDRREIRAGRDVGNVVVQRVLTAASEPIVYDVTFAFVVNAFHPGIEIIGN